MSRIWTWLACVVWCYPIAWLMLSALAMTPVGAFRMMDLRTALYVQAAVSLAFSLWLWRGGRFAAYTAAIAGAVPALFWLVFTMGPRGFWLPSAGLAISTLLLAAALRRTRMSALWLLGAVSLPVAALPFTVLTRQYPPSLFAILAAAIAALILAARWRNPALVPDALTWRPAAAGLALTAAFGSFSWWLPQYRDQQRHALNAQVLASIPPVTPDAPHQQHFFQRGVSFTAEGGASYDSPQAREMLLNLPEYGVNAIALIPFGFTPRGDSGPFTIRPAGRGSWENDTGIEILSAIAHSKGIKVLLKPHIWRGRMELLKDPATRAVWFEQYRAFIVHYAKLAHRIHADLFAIGTELAAATPFQDEWRRIVTEVRAHYRGPLTYAANHGPEFESVAFWDALDYIGIDNYYPLPDDYSTADMTRRITAVHSKFNKPVIFTEAGYSAVENAHRAPWEDETDKPLSLAEQERCYRALLDSFYHQDWFHGVYWWKVGTNGYGGPDNNSMTPWRKPAMELVKTFYSSGRR